MTNHSFYSDRVGGGTPREREEITPPAWKGIVALIRSRIADGSLANVFPMQCPDGSAIAGTDESAFYDLLVALIPGLERPTDAVYGGSSILLDPKMLPPTPTALDVVDFVAQRVAEPQRLNYHSYFRHYHLGFDISEGRARFRADIEMVFARNGIAFTVSDSDRVRRLGPPEARKLISEFTPGTGDSKLDNLLRDGHRRFLSRNPTDRQDALEKLWDAFERLKSLEQPENKRDAVKRLLERSAPNHRGFRQHLDDECRALTLIGNTFLIRHFERGKHELPGEQAVDYLFIRLMSLIAFLLRQTGRMGASRDT